MSVVLFDIFIVSSNFLNLLNFVKIYKYFCEHPHRFKEPAIAEK